MWISFGEFLPGHAGNVDIKGIYPRLIHNIEGVISTYPRTYPHTYPHRKVAIGTIFMQKRKCLVTLYPCEERILDPTSRAGYYSTENHRVYFGHPPLNR